MIHHADAAPARVIIEADPDLLHTIEVDRDCDTVYVFDRLDEAGRPSVMHTIAIPAEHAEAVGRAILLAGRA